jgi:hypothetical protein
MDSWSYAEVTGKTMLQGVTILKVKSWAFLEWEISDK